MNDDGRLRPLLSQFRERVRAPAVGAAVVSASGDLELCVLGDRRRDGDDPARPDDQWHIGSCTKTLTAALYARLVEVGEASWSTSLLECFGDVGDEIDPGWADATISETLQCRAGIPADLSAAEMRLAHLDSSPVAEQRSRALRSALSRPPRNRGSFRYSNLSYVVVGAAIDRLAGMPYEEALRHHLLEPLGIGSAGFGAPPALCGHSGALRLGGLVVGRGMPALPDDVYSDNPAVLNPAGRLHLRLADWATAVRLFLVDGGLLEPASVGRLLDVPAGPGMAMGWAPATRLRRASFGMQGSNTNWVATALLGADRERAALVVVNDGRTRLFGQTAYLAAALLE